MRAEQKHPHQQQQQQWRVNLHARSRNFSVALTATTPIPTWSPRGGHHSLSILLRLWSFVLRVRSDCGTGPPRQRRRFLGSRFLRALGRIRGSRAKKETVAVATREANKAEIGAVRLSVVLVLISAFLLGAISANRLANIGAGVVAVASTILARAPKQFLARQASFALVLLSLWSAVGSPSRAFDLAKYVDFAGDWVPGILWKIWKSAAS
ncbi:uncharacterized protein LOC115729106 [Rhodamnia argentea]|uniref:Uncharacterized protein LOC115729106 n=1 Tax=Rhodamnia argentea TaxID=178133 RepID=A0A8B8MZ59_9MYRT|nr:uncharacterized protein LOC115729106 [Rhodamnia argentea]